ncbi:MAG: carotenoid 1,2-hydratase, partial [Armatimonadota bacterium]|nr:carotenoid 1,2-hydratase [Armatimonadota bacterium]
MPAPSLSSGFVAARPGYSFQWPRDSGAHPGSKTEWWYYTGHLHSRNGDYGFELTFFRVGLSPHPLISASHWATSTLYLAHFALTDKAAGQFHAQELSDRGALGYAGADTDRENVWLGNWRAQTLPTTFFVPTPAEPQGATTGPPDDPRLWP